MKVEKIRVLLADDHLVVRMGLAAIISFEKDLKLVFTRFNAATRTEAVAIAVARGFVRL